MEWLQDMTNLVNQGKYSMQTRAYPTGATRGTSGDFHIAKDGTKWYLYVYCDNTDKWRKAELVVL